MLENIIGTGKRYPKRKRQKSFFILFKINFIKPAFPYLTVKPENAQGWINKTGRDYENGGKRDFIDLPILKYNGNRVFHS